MRVDILHQFLEEFERDARNIGQQRLVERIQSIRASTDPLDYLRKLLAKEHGVSNFQDSSRRTWFKTFVSPEGERLSNEDIDTLVSITKGWELNDTQVNDLQIATQLWTKEPEFFWFGQEHQDILLQTLENLNRIKDVDPMKRKLWLIITSEFMEELQHASPPTQKRISNSDPYGKRVRTGIAKSGRNFVQNRWPDFSDHRKLKLAKDFARYSNKGWKYRQLKKPSLVLSLNGANVLRFEDKAWTGLRFSALNAWIEGTRQFTIIGDLDTAYKAIMDFYNCTRTTMTPIVTPCASITNNFESFPRHTEAIRPHGHKRPRQDEDAAVSRRYRPSSAHMDTAAVLSNLPNCVRVYSPLFVSQPHNNIERDGNNNESQSHVPNEESEHQPTTGASVNYAYTIGENNAQTTSTNQSTVESTTRVLIEKDNSVTNSFQLPQSSYEVSGIEQPSNCDEIPSHPEADCCQPNGPSFKIPRIEASEINATETLTSSDGLRLTSVPFPEVSSSVCQGEDAFPPNEWHLDELFPPETHIDDIFPPETHIDDIFPPETHIDDIFPPETHLYDLVPGLNEAAPLEDTAVRT